MPTALFNAYLKVLVRGEQPRDAFDCLSDAIDNSDMQFKAGPAPNVHVMM